MVKGSCLRQIVEEVHISDKGSCSLFRSRNKSALVSRQHLETDTFVVTNTLESIVFNQKIPVENV